MSTTKNTGTPEAQEAAEWSAAMQANRRAEQAHYEGANRLDSDYAEDARESALSTPEKAHG